jgi:branched-chain amino acid transport system permease protein
VVLCCLVVCYLVSRWVLSSAFGRVLLGIRENEARIELLGYNAPAYKTAIFSLSAAMAGMAGCLFASWAEIVTPALFGLGQSVEVIIWVIAGGLGTLMGPIIGAVLLGTMKLLLGGQTFIDNSLVIGAILVLVVLLLPKGLLPTLMGWRKQHGQRSVNRAHSNSMRRRGGERRQQQRRKRARQNRAPIMSEMIVETRDLSMRFGGVLAVNNVNFNLRERELRCLIGPNGAGKSTLFKCMTGLHQINHSNGRVFIRGHDVTGWRPHEIVQLGVGIKTQVPSVMNGLTVWENLWLSARRIHGKKGASPEVDRVIAELGLQTHVRRMVGELAHGQRQIVEIGLVCVSAPNWCCWTNLLLASPVQRLIAWLN